MKLKQTLILAFLLLTVIPSVIVSLLLYKSGFDLSKMSYTRNLTASIGVQADYISQSMENNMIADSRFAQKVLKLAQSESSDALLTACQNYLDGSEDKISTCLLLDSQNEMLYSIGDRAVVDAIHEQLPPVVSLKQQQVIELELNSGDYGLSIVTPVHYEGHYLGRLVSVYSKSYLFKIISSYYELSDTTTYICRSDSDIISTRGYLDGEQDTCFQSALHGTTLTAEGGLLNLTGDRLMVGYYQSIYNTPWYLVGFLDYAQIYGFINQFIWVYLLIIAAIIITAIILSVYFSGKVIAPINSLIQLMEGYPDSLKDAGQQAQSSSGYVETRYLRSTFLNLMKTILLVQHNFEAIYQLYQSSAMADTNIDIDVIAQAIHSNKASFDALMNELVMPEGACVVERFTRCFCDEDQVMLMNVMEGMRDEHLSVTQEAEVFTPHLDQKWFHVLVVPMYDGNRLSRLFIQLRDVSSFKRRELQSRDQAKRDPLTGIYNRAGLADAAVRAIADGGATATYGVLFLDINDFKLVNDTFGHSTGDQLLRTVSRALTNIVDTEGISARMGGDEFAVFLPCTTMARVEELKQTLTQQLHYPYHAGETSFIVTASIGSAALEQIEPQMLEQLLDAADADMYRVKRQRKQRMGARMDKKV